MNLIPKLLRSKEAASDEICSVTFFMPTSAQDSPPTRPRLLVVEDHVATRDKLAFLLQRHGYEVTVASNGESAKAILAAPDGPTIALLDWMLPDVTGLDVCRALRNDPAVHFIYFIIITARDSTSDLAEAFEAGADDFIPKPCDPTELLARLRSAERIVELEHRLSARVTQVEEALENVRRLRQLLPICMYCKKIRDDSQYWQEIDAYFHEQAGTAFSHGICPDCMIQLDTDRPVGSARLIQAVFVRKSGREGHPPRD